MESEQPQTTLSLDLVDSVSITEPPILHARLAGQTVRITAIALTPDEKYIVSGSADGTLRVYNTSTYTFHAALRAHSACVYDVRALDNDIIASIGHDDILRLSHISERRLLFHIPLQGHTILPLSHHRIACLGFLIIHVVGWSAHQPPHRVASYRGFTKGMVSYCIWKDTLATGHNDGRIKLWNSTRFRHIRTIHFRRAIPKTVSRKSQAIMTCIDINDDFIVHAGGPPHVRADTLIFIRHPKKFSVLRIIKSHPEFAQSIKIVGPNSTIFCLFQDNTLCLHDPLSGAMLWTIRRPMENWRCKPPAVLADGRIVGADDTELDIFSPSEPIARLFRQHSSSAHLITLDNLPPLQRALTACIAGETSPAQSCATLINPENCSASFDEWQCAHRLAVMAVQDGDIPKALDYNGQLSFWYENLYLVIKDVLLSSEAELHTLKLYLKVAKSLNLIETVEAVLGPLHVTKSLNEKISALHRAGIIIVGRLLEVDGRLERLKNAYERYRAVQRFSQLVGIALQIIPVAGGAVAGALSAGANVIEGLSVKDVTDYVFQLGTVVAKDVGENIIQKAANVLSDEALRRMKPASRQRLEEAVAYCGLKVEQLHSILLNKCLVDLDTDVGAQVDSRICEPAIVLAEKGEAEYVQREAEYVQEEAEHKEEHEVNQIDEALIVKGIDCLGTVELKEPTALACNQLGEGSATATEGWGFLRGFGAPERMPLLDCRLETQSLEEIASMWANFIVEYDEKRQHEYDSFYDCILCILRRERISPKQLATFRATKLQTLASTVADAFQRDEKISFVGLGDKWRVEEFLYLIGIQK